MHRLMPAASPSHAARRRAPVLALALGLVLAATAAQASDRGRAERLYTKGLAELHAGHGEAALALFQQAVDADPKDVHGLYYRALGYGHVGRYEDAATDLAKVVAANDPTIERARLELGYALYRLGRYDEAAAQLEEASKGGASAAEATMLLGIVETRRGNHEAARAALARVEGQDPTRVVPAHYYRGLAAWRAGDQADARREFEWVEANGGDSPFVREAGSFLERMGDTGNRRYRLYAGMALEYDSNVALAPDSDNLTNNVLGLSNRDDGRSVLTAGGRYALLHQGDFRMSVGYDFLQSLHFDLERFDVQTHRVGTQSQYTKGPLTVGLVTSYEHSLLDEDSLLHGYNLLPWVRFEEGEFGRTEAYYRARRRDYLPADFNQSRDSWNHATGLRQFFHLGSRSRSVVVGYRYDGDVADNEVFGRPYNYDGHQFEGGLEWLFDETLAADLLYVYRLENYSSTSGNRDDDEHQVIARLEKRVAEYVWMTGSYIYRDNQSDQSFFDYSRHITSLGVEVRY